MDRQPIFPALLASAALLAAPASAAEYTLGIGQDGVFDGDGAVAAGVTLSSGPVAEVGPVAFGYGVAIEADTDGDFWIGGGGLVYWPSDAAFRLDASLMAGGYLHGNGDDLGSALQFRSRVGVSRRVGPGPWRVGVALEHKSNADLVDYNPGVETLFLTVGRSF